MKVLLAIEVAKHILKDIFFNYETPKELISDKVICFRAKFFLDV